MRPARASRQLRLIVRPEQTLHTVLPLSPSRYLCVFCQRRPSRPPTLRDSQVSLFQASRYASIATTPTTPSQTNSSNAPTSSPDLTSNYTIFPKTLPKGPPPNGSFHINLSNLRREFLKLQATAHPDKFPPGPLKQRAEALSARINEAYRTLSDPLLRAQYILQTQHDIDVLSEDSSSQPQDPQILMEVMEAQEDLESADEEEEIETMKSANKERVERTVNKLGQCLENGDVEGARREAVRLRFWRSLGEALHSWERGKEVRLVH